MINPHGVDEVLAGEDGVVDFPSPGASEGEIEDDVVFFVEGVSFYNKEERQYIFAATDRFDETITKRRCIRNKNFKLIINYDTNLTFYKPIKYRTQMATMKILDSLNRINQNSKSFERWYNLPESKFELYNINIDPYEQNNLYFDQIKLSFHLRTN